MTLSTQVGTATHAQRTAWRCEQRRSSSRLQINVKKELQTGVQRVIFSAAHARICCARWKYLQHNFKTAKRLLSAGICIAQESTKSALLPKTALTFCLSLHLQHTRDTHSPALTLINVYTPCFTVEEFMSV